MKNLFLLMALLGSFIYSAAQDLPDFSSINIKTAADFNAKANDAALKAAAYILSTPPAEGNARRKEAGSYLVNWATGSPEYSLNIDVALTKLTDGKPELLLVSIAAMIQYMMLHKADKDDVDKVRLNAVKKLLDYVKDPANGITAEGELAKAIAADKRGKLNEYLVQQAR